MCCTIVLIALISSRVTRNSASDDDDHHAFISSLSAAAIIMMNSGTQEQLHQWQQYLQEHYGIQLKVLPLSLSKEEVLDHDFTPILKKMQRANFSLEEVIAPPFVIIEPFMTTSQLRYRLIAKLPAEFFAHYRFNHGNIIFRFIAAMLISGFICYLLSLYLLRPIRVLQRAARKLGQGQLQTRVYHALGRRKDEIGELAHDFDEMAARLESLVHSKQQLLQDISHELRSPLARLSVALEMAKDKSPGAVKELLRITEEADKLNALIQQILSLSRLDTASLPIIFEEIDLAELIHSIVSDANYEKQQHTSPIIFFAATACPAWVNYALLRSAIENVIRNALRYTPEQQTIRVFLRQKKNHAQIVIEDSGPGIPPAKMTYIFDPFFRVDDSRAQRTGGFGLGLAIAKKAVLLHHGTIAAENIATGGLRVTLTLSKLVTTHPQDGLEVQEKTHDTE